MTDTAAQATVKTVNSENNQQCSSTAQCMLEFFFEKQGAKWQSERKMESIIMHTIVAGGMG